MDICQLDFSYCSRTCPCNENNADSIGSRTLILADQTARIFSWYSDNNEQVQTLTPLYTEEQYFEFNGYKAAQSCQVFYQGKYWFIGGTSNRETMMTLEPTSCSMKNTGFILPDPMYRHSCAVLNDLVWICAGADHSTRCYT